MRRILASTFVLALFAMAFAGPPVDYELYCGEGDDPIGVLSVTEGTVHVALVEGVVCDDVVLGLENPPNIEVAIVWDDDQLTAIVTINDGEPEDVDLVIVPQVAIDGMANAQRLRAAAMEMRVEAEARREAAREGHEGDGEYGESGDREPAGPPVDVPPVEVPPVEVPPVEVPPVEVPPTEAPPVQAPGRRP